MSRRASPTLIGIFVLGAVSLAVITILLLAGGEWFQNRRQVIMYFEGSAEGLQVGAPVVFLGVKIGTVKQIKLGLDESTNHFLVPVRAELDPRVIQQQNGKWIDLGDPQVTHELVNQGLRAQLRMKSLLTGQLYIDLNFHPDKPAQLIGHSSSISEIPTIPTTVEELSSQLEGFPIEKFLTDVAAISESLHTIMASAADRNLPAKLETTLLHLESLVETLDTRGGPIMDEIETNLVAMKGAIANADKAIVSVGEAADRLSDLAKPDSVIMTTMQDAGEELTQAAKALHDIAEDKSPTIYSLNTALQEVARAARALRLLAETLERQPEAILRGKTSRESY
jgi:paraquat-inducible protein B